MLKAKRGDMTPFKTVRRPFFDAGSWRTPFTVWMKSPGYQLAGRSPFMIGREIYSEPGNVNGFISDGDAGTFRVSYNGKAQAEAFFGVAIDAPVMVSRAVYTAGNVFHDGGWHDASKGKPRFEVKRTADSPWESVGEFTAYPETTSTDARGLKPGTKFELSFTPVPAVAIRVTGVPACGDKPLQAFASCADILAFE
ncbi:MAG: hypothetical protein HZC28_20480 [Spirochaetes bacterium]|nr:hypothetical protein [Spirochaetota bacterium]